MRAPLSLCRCYGVTVAVFGLALASVGCAWQTYAVTRSVREVTGAKVRLHVIVPMGVSLRRYDVIELTPLADLVGDRLPAPLERYLNERMIEVLGGLGSAPTTVVAAGDADPAAPALAIDRFLDDYDAGSRSLRVVELGFNHIAVTLRVRLRDKQTGDLLGAASVTAEDDRASGTTKAAIDHAVKRIGDFVRKGYAR
jgi:hypothetical protein